MTGDTMKAFARDTYGSPDVDVTTLSELIETGTIEPVIDRTFPLHEAPPALRYLEEKRAAGKIVVTVSP